MPDYEGRVLLRGAEEKIFDSIWEMATDGQLAKWLRVPLEIAAELGDLDLVEKLQHAGAVGNAFHPAVRGGHTDMVCNMLMVGHPTHRRDWRGDTPLHVAATLGHDDIVRLLLLKGASPHETDKENLEPLHLAIKYGNFSSAKALLVGGAEANGRHPHTTDSPLHVAVSSGYTDMMRTLIQHGADVDATSSDGITALQLAAKMNMIDAIDVLVEHSADLECREGDDTHTPLCQAVSSLHYEATLSLLRHGADTEAITHSQHTPLHMAAFNAGAKGCAELVDLLLRWGADETKLNWMEKTPLELIREFNDSTRETDPVERVEYLLRNAVADRAWRRRGLPILCRALPESMLLNPRKDQGGRKAWMVPAVAKVQKVDVRMHQHFLCFGKHPLTPYEIFRHDSGSEGGGGEGGGREERRRGAGELTSLTVGLLLGLEDDDVFRNIVGFL